MEDFKSALKAQCNDNFAQCNVISCETRVWKTSFPNKAHICHGNTYDDLLAYYAPKHAAQIAEMTTWLLRFAFGEPRLFAKKCAYTHTQIRILAL